MSRRSEIRRMQDLVADVRDGRSRSLVLVGPAGIGKSWLCRRTCALATGFTVVHTRGLESEAHLGYCGLFDVLSPLVEDRLERLHPARSEALRGALQIAAAPVVDSFAVAVASLDLLAIAAEDAPVLVVVDDAPWVDAASLAALRFSARRLDADRVGFLFAARGEHSAAFVDAGMEALTVGGLDMSEAVTLVNEFAGSEVAGSVALALAAAGREHPLWLREAARELSPAQRTGAVPLSARFRAPANVHAAFVQLALGMTGPARHALVTLAADEHAPALVMEQALADLGLVPSELQAGLDCGLAHLEGGRPRFSHPLAKAAVLEVADPAQRRLAHEALAHAWDEPERAAWHLAAAGDGPDAQVSSALAGVARAARARGAPGAAAEAWRRAVQTAPDADQALRLRLEGARDLARAGRAPEALAELDEILDRGPGAELRADAELLRGQLLISQGQLAQAVHVLEACATRIRADDPARAAVLLCEAAFAKGIQGQVTAALGTANAAVELAGPLGGASAATAEATLGWALIAAGEGERGYPLLLRRSAAARGIDGLQASARLGQFACWVEDYDTARRELEPTVALARERGHASVLPLVLSDLAELEYRVGNWRAARTHAEEALRLAHDADQIVHLAQMVLLVLDAVTGDVDGARAYADVVSAIAAHCGSGSHEMYATAGLGLLELGLDHPEAAIVQLSRTRELGLSGGIGEPNMVRWMPDLIESQIRAGLEPEARDTLAEFEAQAQRTGRGWALGTAARCQGLLAPPESVDTVFAEAHHLVSPFERARTELCWGERLRRDGRRVDARAHLHEAHRAFDALGAVPWTEKAARELRSSGGRAQRGPRARSRELTAQEAQIATMVTEGSTNKTIATALFLSPKTIEFHLGHIYRKLEVSNRTQLAHALLTH